MIGQRTIAPTEDPVCGMTVAGAGFREHEVSAPGSRSSKL